MAFIFLCGLVAFIVQMIVLHSCKHHRRMLRLLPLVAMELFPACIAAYSFATRQPGGILGWEFSMAICGWVAGAFLIGYMVAWIVFKFSSKGDDTQ